MIEATPWRALLMQAHSLGVAPRQFWRLSLREWRALMRPDAGALSRSSFEDLLQRFPDQGHG